MLLMAAATMAPMTAWAADVPTGGTISVSMREDASGQAGASDAFVDAATIALSDKGFTLLDDGHAALVMELTIRSTDVGTGTGPVDKSSSDLAAGGVRGAVGSHFTLPVPSGKTRLVALQRMELEMRLHKRGDEAVLWRGSAVTVRPEGNSTAVASALCNALLRAYPEQSEAVIGVP